MAVMSNWSEEKQRAAAMAVSLAVGTALMAVKFYAFWITQSAAVLSDAIESIINIVASGFALVSVLVAAKPPDPDHPYGHGKIEFFSAGFEGALIMIAAAAIVWEALPRIWAPMELPNLDWGLFVLLAATGANLALGLALVRVGRRTRSLAVVADGKHVLTDVITSAGVLAGLVLVRQTGWLWLDGAVACMVAINILVIGGRLVHQSASGLMDQSDPELLDQISALISQHRKPAWIDIHHLRALRSGGRIHVDFHIILPRELSLEEAHTEVAEIERLLKTHLPGMGDAFIHAEPCIVPECPVCGFDPCSMRREPTRRQNLWRADTLTTQTELKAREQEHNGGDSEGPDSG
jgi:cation diffusion facilitator family transporter